MRRAFRRRLVVVNIVRSVLPCSPVAPGLSASRCFAGGHPSVPSDLPLDAKKLLYWRHLDPVVSKFGGFARHGDESEGGAGNGRLRGFAEAHWRRIESELVSSEHAEGGRDDGGGEWVLSGLQPGQECDAPFPGLPPAVPWPDESKFPWIQAVERGSDAVVSELVDFLAATEGGDRNDQIRSSSSGEPDVAWTPSSTKLCSDTSSFSRLELRDWKGRATEVGHRHFPRTLRLLRDAVETPHPHTLAPRPVSINRQGPRSGLAPHSDNANFVLVCHLGLVVPSASHFGAVPCRFVMEGTRSRPLTRCDDHRRPSSGLVDVAPSYKEWKQGKVVVADTSFVHSTVNESENENRFVLHFVVWHPNLTKAESDGIVAMHRALDSFEAECADKGL